jgi:hypothetical protein
MAAARNIAFAPLAVSMLTGAASSAVSSRNKKK